MSDKCRHIWVAVDDQHQCEQCGDTCATCNVCKRASGSALLVCDRCLEQCARVLTDIEDALSHWQHQPRSVVQAIRYDQDRRGGNADHVPLTLTDNPADIEAVLRDWAEMWADLSGSAKNVGPVEYLRGHHMWAAHNAEGSGWDDYRREMRQLRHRARRMAGLLPQRQAGMCIYCGDDVVRDWADEKWQPRSDGLSDELRCTGCRTQWEDRERWQFANRHTILALPQTHPDRLITRDDARMVFPEVPPATWRWWVMRDAKRGEALLRYAEMIATGRLGPEPEPERMPVQSWDQRGRPLYRLADLTAHVEARASETRRGPKAGAARLAERRVS